MAALVGLAALLGATAAVVALPRPPSSTLRTITFGSSTPVTYPGALALDDRAGRAYLGVSDGSGPSHLLVLDLKTGKTLHTIGVFAPVGAVTVDEETQRLFVATTASANSLTMLDARSGATLRHIGLMSAAELAVDPRTNRVYVTSSGTVTCSNASCSATAGTILTLDGRSGRTLRTMTLPGEGVTTLALAAQGRRLIVTGSTSTPVSPGGPTAVQVFVAASGRLLRRVHLSGMAWQPFIAADTLGRAFGITVASATVVGRRNLCHQTLMALDVRRAVLAHITPLSGCVAGLALDARQGRLIIAEYGPTRQVTVAQPGGGSETMLLPTGASGVQVRDVRSAALLRTIPIGPATVAVAVDERRGYLYVANAGMADAQGAQTESGRLSVVDERRGTVVRTVPVGVNPVRLELDQRAHRLFVFSAGSFTPGPAPDPWGWVPSWLQRWLPFLPRHAPQLRRVPVSVSILDTTRL